MIQIPTTKELFEAMVYFGHRQGKGHPKMAPYIYGLKDNVHIIDLEKTRQQLKELTNFVQQIISQNGLILFVGTKPAAKEIVKKYAQEVGMPYVTERWLGGTLSNFSIIAKLIQKFKKMEKEKELNEWEKYPKKEKVDLEREFNRLNLLVGGMKNMESKPAAVFIVDLKKEKTAVRETRLTKIPTIALVDTNTNPELVDWPIPANDDASKSIEIITRCFTGMIKEEQRKMKVEEKKFKESNKNN